MRLLPAVLVAVAAACALGGPGPLPARVAVDAVDPELQSTLQLAREHLERGDARSALATVDAVLDRKVDVVEAQRLRQDVLRQRGRSGLARAEAAARVQKTSHDPIAHYLQGRLLTGTEMLAAFARAAELAPDRVWPWLGSAYALREADPARSLRIYQQLYEACDRHPTVGVAFANMLRSQGKLREAIGVYEHLSADAATAGIGQLGLAQSCYAMGSASDRQRGWQALLAATALRPFDPGVHAAVRELLRLGLADEQVQVLLDVLRADPGRRAAFGGGGGAEVLALLLQRSGQPSAALALLRGRDARNDSPAIRRLVRRLLLQVGEVGQFLRELRREVPAALLADETNQVRGRWRSLFDGPWCTGEPLPDVPTAGRLLEALRDLGLLVEAEAVAAVASLRFGDEATALAVVVDEVRREIAFEEGLRRLLYEGYADGHAHDFDAFLDRVRVLSSETLGRDVVGDTTRFHVPFVGEMLDPFRAGLCLHLARYNRHCILGRRSGGAIEGLILTRLSVADLAPMPELPVVGRCQEVIGFDRSVRSLSGVLGGDLAGVALLNHYVVDRDAVVEWAAAVAARRRIAREDGNALLSDPEPDRVAPLDPLDVSWRIAAMSSLEDSELEAAVLEIIRHHERRHLVDSFHYLPFEANVWRGLGLLLRFGLSPTAIEAEMERRAELAALAHSARPELVLGHIADFIVDDEASPHALGFTQLARELTVALQAEGVAAADAAVSRWHRLDAALVRRCALGLLGELP